MLPPDRIGSTRFFLESGISKTEFYRTGMRADPGWIKRLDIRLDPQGRLSFSLEAARTLARDRLGKPAVHPSPRAERLKIACPFCAEMIQAAAKICRYCDRDVGR